ncbi:MAG: EMC3/TMCO1 family protein [Candidatus Micrarchaeota archaeon]|nr:EMC3/TMCO1 family protein [Candidatus Micrarchaeota archaeon]
MDYTFFLIFVTVVSMIYSFVVRVVQMKVGNQKEMQVLQAESKRLGDEYKRASENKDQKKMDESMKQQMELFPKMNGMMMGQFKSFIPILLVFFAFTFVINTLDPTTKDDFILQLSDNGLGCDKFANDLIYSGCITLNGSNYGIWNVDGKITTGDNSLIQNSSYFSFSNSDSNRVYHRETGIGFLDGFLGKKAPSFSISTDKTNYELGDEAKVYATSSVKGNVTAVLDSGTMFAVPIPVGDVVIYEAYWWFIIFSFLFGFVVSWVMGKLDKSKKTEPKKGS